MTILDNITTLLFDLDNTLVFMDENEFVISYATNAASYFSDIFPDPKVFVHHLLAGTRYMVTTKNSKSNIEKFFDYFLPQCGKLSKEEVYNRFLTFYTNDFDNVKNIVKTNSIVPKIFDKVIKNFQIVIATNPLFPKVATVKRIQWAGLGSYVDKLTLVTHGEEFSTAKPDLAYYQEILDKINRKATECLVIGNDLYNDGSGSLLGMKFYHIVNKVEDGDFLSKMTRKDLQEKDIKVTATGTLEDFYELL